MVLMPFLKNKYWAVFIKPKGIRNRPTKKLIKVGLNKIEAQLHKVLYTSNVEPNGLTLFWPIICVAQSAYSYLAHYIRQMWAQLAQ